VFESLSAAGCGDAELLAQGTAMRDALVEDLRRAGDWMVDSADRAVGGDADALDVVAQTSISYDRVWVIAPETGRLLERLHGAVGAARWVGCDVASIEVASSKRATAELLAAHGVQTALDFAARATRWVVKPDDGAGALDTRVHPTRERAAADIAQRAMRCTLEPWVDGDALSLSLVCAQGEADLLAINRQRIAIDRDGALAYQGVEVGAIGRSDARAAPLGRLAAQVARALPGLRGCVGVDVVWHAVRGPVAIEINPRLTCAYVGLSAALGRNVAAEVLKLHD